MKAEIENKMIDNRRLQARENPSSVTSNQLDESVVIQTVGLSMFFGRSSILHDVNLTIPSGAIYSLVGPNGAGKTTLLKLLMNIYRPTSGVAAVLGQDSRSATGTSFTRIGYVSENQELPDWMTLGYFLDYLHSFYPTWDTDIEDQLIHQFDLRRQGQLKHLSRGQKMKARFVSALSYRPTLIVLDEPFSGLDPLVRDELIDVLLERASETTILLSSHDLDEIESFATDVGYLDQGRLIFSENISSLVARFRKVEVTLSWDTINPSASAHHAPPSWLLHECSSSLIRFVHMAANTEPVEQQITAMYPNMKGIQLHLMDLRSIFLALAKSRRTASDWGRI